MAALRDRLPELPGTTAAHMTVERADDFSYRDPVDGSEATRPGRPHLLPRRRPRRVPPLGHRHLRGDAARSISSASSPTRATRRARPGPAGGAHRRPCRMITDDANAIRPAVVARPAGDRPRTRPRTGVQRPAPIRPPPRPPHPASEDRAPDHVPGWDARKPREMINPPLAFEAEACPLPARRESPNCHGSESRASRVWSRHATRLSVCLFDPRTGRETRPVPISRRATSTPSSCPGLGPGARYGLRARRAMGARLSVTGSTRRSSSSIPTRSP
jgi:hypothetical protein